MLLLLYRFWRLSEILTTASAGRALLSSMSYWRDRSEDCLQSGKKRYVDFFWRNHGFFFQIGGTGSKQLRITEENSKDDSFQLPIWQTTIPPLCFVLGRRRNMWPMKWQKLLEKLRTSNVSRRTIQKAWSDSLKTGECVYVLAGMPICRFYVRFISVFVQMLQCLPKNFGRSRFLLSSSFRCASCIGGLLWVPSSIFQRVLEL